jgi:hypothetical protein
MRKAITAAIVAGTVLLATPPALALTKSQAVRAVEREIKADYGIGGYRGGFSEATCRKITARRYRCTWFALSRADVNTGNTDGWEGTARVTQYGGGRIDVSLSVTQRGL